MTKPNHIGKLMAVLAIAVSWAHKVGEWQASVKSPFDKGEHLRVQVHLILKLRGLENGRQQLQTCKRHNDIQ